MDTLRPIIPDGGSHKGTGHCAKTGCPNTTREGKPYCPLHIEEGWYIQDILAELDRREAEIERLKNGGTIDRDGHLVREALILLRLSSYTSKNLARRLDVPHEAAERLIHLLVRWKFANKGATERGDVTICLEVKEDEV